MQFNKSKGEMKHLYSIILTLVALFAMFTSCSVAEEQKEDVKHAYFAPYGVFTEGLIGSIRPRGWIEEFLNRQVSGLTGHPEAMCYPFNSCLWNGEIRRETEEHGDDWWRYEQTAYYTDGLLRLGYLLNNQDMIKVGEDGIHYTLSHLTEDGSYGFREYSSKPEPMNVGKKNAAGEWLLLWPQAVFFRAIQAYYEVTGDSEIPSFLERHFLNFTGANIGSTRNIVNVEGILWTYARTGNIKLLELAEEAWKDGHFELNEAVCLQDEPLYMHGVSCCEELKVPILLYAYTGNEHYLNLALRAEKKVEDENMLPDGIPSSAEHLAGRVANHSHETCDITDFSWSMGYYLMTTGQAKWGDRIERAVFNAAPGAIGKDFKSLQYFSSVNQFNCTGNSNNNDFMHGKSWMEYRPVHETECCAGNIHRVMPNYVARMWLQSREDDIVAAMYGPSEVTFPIGANLDCTIVEDTEYPFDDVVNFSFRFEKNGHKVFGRHFLSFAFRIPEWSRSVSVYLNGRKIDYEKLPGGFGRVCQKFSSRDILSIEFDNVIALNEFNGQGCYVDRGPLLFSYSIPTETVIDTVSYPHLNGKVPANPDFKSWSKSPSGKWNYAMKGLKVDALVLEREHSNGYPFDEPPLKISIPVTEIADWELKEGVFTPSNPVDVRPLDGSVRTIDLVPYGCTYLRLTVFPVVN